MKRRLVYTATGAMASMLWNAGRRKPAPVASTPTVPVAEVMQKDVPIYSEWVGTTAGFVDAQIRAVRFSGAQEICNKGPALLRSVIPSNSLL